MWRILSPVFMSFVLNELMILSNARILIGSEIYPIVNIHLSNEYWYIYFQNFMIFILNVL